MQLLQTIELRIETLLPHYKLATPTKHAHTTLTLSSEARLICPCQLVERGCRRLVGLKWVGLGGHASGIAKWVAGSGTKALRRGLLVGVGEAIEVDQLSQIPKEVILNSFRLKETDHINYCAGVRGQDCATTNYSIRTYLTSDLFNSGLWEWEGRGG